MKILLITIAVLASVAARPELYKESENFQYSRSSSDEGSKSGYYGAQRGNMGGNYERAHNMDTLAQHQMSGLVSQVEGDLGEASNTKTGNVFASANSRGIYRSGTHDLSNLQGRNFVENSHNDGIQTHSSDLSSTGFEGYSSSHGSSSSHTHNSRYTGAQQQSISSEYGLQGGNLRTTNGQNAAVFDSSKSGYTSGYNSQSGYQRQSSYNNNANLYSGSSSNPQSRLIYTVPVRVVVRPGSRVAIPVGVQTYDAAHSAAVIDQNAVNSEAEVLTDAGHITDYRPTSNSKHSESSYSYNKQWENHDTKPEVVALAIPTENYRNSELYDDHILQANNQHQTVGSHSSYDTKSSQSRSHSYNSHQRNSLNTALNSNAYTQGAFTSGSTGSNANLINEDNSKPKSYQSSYSYHKSWERQGDPYVIVPDGQNSISQASQRLTAGSNQQGYSSHQYGNRHYQSHQSHSSLQGIDCDCDENGNLRVARSVGQYQDYLGQQTQTVWENNQDLSQQTQDLSQQVQTGWNHDFENLEDLGQQTQDLSQQTQDLSQQAQTGWNHENFENLEDLGQQTQDLSQQTQDLGQQTQDLSQQTQDLGQQTQDLGQQTQDLGQQLQKGWNEDYNQLRQNVQHNQDFSAPYHTPYNELTQQSQNRWNTLHQQINQQNLENHGQQTERK